MSKNAMTLGADPELMLLDREQGRIVSSIPVLKHDKHDPIDLKDGVRMYADNVLVETAFPPVTSADEFVNRVRDVLKRMTKHLGSKYSLVPQAAYEYPKEELQDKVAWEAGCNPNFDVYQRDMNLPADFTSGLRTGSFHIHIGSEKLKGSRDKEAAIKLCDVFVGCASVVFDHDASALKRRALYGKAGEFRPTPYGVEYRVLGNYALRCPKVTRLVIDLVLHAMSFIEDGSAEELLKTIDQHEVITSINTNNRSRANEVLFNAGLPTELIMRVNSDHKLEPNLKSWGL